ncbi:MAG TPA: hypothetical protein VMG82_10290, partial [Candidatus Sulfotelmatobacter sp.]|nr:hypothetical protein [Candidatus Sulfotelmatobacter sp.]
LGPDEPVALTGHRKVATDVRAALATRLAALSGSHIKASGSAGGYLLAASQSTHDSHRRGDANVFRARAETPSFVAFN